VFALLSRVSFVYGAYSWSRPKPSFVIQCVRNLSPGFRDSRSVSVASMKGWIASM
jgi:hypothetical protein